jgi:chaperone required for assembly of F1-ATPase
VPTAALAEAIAAEWAAQGETIEPASMPLTRLVNTVIDAVVSEARAVAADVVAFAASDLLCYRAEHPRELVAMQRAAWDPVLAWAEREHAVALTVVPGVMPVEQPQTAIARLGEVVGRIGDPYRLASLHMITTLTGSALLALAHLAGRLTADEVWRAAHVDEDFQISQWGADAEAAERRRKRRAEFDAAVRLARLVGEVNGR